MYSGLARSLLRSSRPALREVNAWSASLRVLSTVVDGPPVTATNRAEATLRRFWKSVGIEARGDGLAVTLDKKTLKTPSGNALVLPRRKRLLASVIATEWENQDKVLKSHALPATSLASRAIDSLRDKSTRDEVIEALLKYVDTDTICFHEERPATLVARQKEHWIPLIAWTNSEFDVNIITFDSILGNGQPDSTKAKLSEVIRTVDEWQLAALERATYATKSFLIALALVHGRIGIEQAAEAAHVEVNSQIDKWGEVEDSHDVDYHDIRRQLGSAACVLANI